MTTQAFGSMGLPETRVLSRVRRVTCAAFANASRIFASSPYTKSKATLPGTDS
jgi:hypothetical protein